jgi:hypothetical protein
MPSRAIKRDEIAARQLHALRQHCAGKLRLSDVKEMFEQMQDRAQLRETVTVPALTPSTRPNHSRI